MKAAFKWVSGIMIAILIIIALLYGFRHPLAVSLTNHYLAPYQLRLDCLQFSLTRQAGRWQVQAQQLCLSGAGFTLSGEHLSYDGDALEVARLTVIHQPSNQPATTEMQPLRWQIPTLPAVSIAALNLQSPMLRQPLELAVQYDQGKLKLDGPWQASISLADNHAKAYIDWSLADLADYLPLPATLPPELLTSLIQSQINFDGQHVTSQHALAIAFPYALAEQDCQIELAAKGTLGLSLDIIGLQGQLDLSALPLNLVTGKCPLPQAIANAYQPGQIQITVPQPATLSLQHLAVPHLQVVLAGNTTGQLTLDDLRWQSPGTLTGQYQLASTLTPDAQQAALFPLAIQGQGQFALQLSTDQPQYQLSGQDWQISAKTWQGKDWQADNIMLTSDFTYDLQQGGEITASIKMATGHFKDNVLGKLSASLSAQSADLSSAKGQLEMTLDTVTTGQGLASTLRHQQQFSLQDALFTFSGSSQIKQLQLDKWKLADIGLSHEATLPLAAPLQGSSLHRWQLASGLHGQVEQVQEQINLTLPPQNAARFTAFARPLLPQLSFTQGKLGAKAKYNLSNETLSGELDIASLSLSYQDYQVKEINLAAQVSQHSGNLHLTPARLDIASVDVGVAIRDISGQLMADEQGLRIQDLSGSLLDGSFLLPRLQLSEQPQQLTLHLKGLDAKQLASLGKESGIEVRGRINVDVPIKLAGKQIEVQGGSLYNEGPAKLLIYDNQAFEDLLASQPTLAPSLSALKNLDISSVTSKVDLKPDGWLNLEMKIKGHNPGQKQDVNFNYTHEENLFTLLRALQLGDEVQKKVQEKIK